MRHKKAGIYLLLVVINMLCMGCSNGEMVVIQDCVPESKSDVDYANQSEGNTGNWQEAYLDIICNIQDYLVDVDDSRRIPEIYDPMDIWGYLGIHDFDGDNIPELIAGDTITLAVFTFYQGRAEKLADLYFPDMVWCINGVQFKDHSVSVTCAGSDGCDYVNFGFLDGEYKLGLYSEYDEQSDEIINGKVSTLEELNCIYVLDFDERAGEEWRDRIRLAYKKENWYLIYHSGYEVKMDDTFDFSQIEWN